MMNVLHLFAAAMALLGTGLPLHAAQPSCRGHAAAANVKTEFGKDSFAINMFCCIVAKERGNVTFSPASLENLLTLLETGARGKTLAAIRAVPGGQIGVHSAMKVESANALFVADDLKLKPQKLQDIRTVSFYKPQDAVSAINDWCRLKTHGLISELVSVQSIHPSTRMVALNAVYLKEKWLNPFNKSSTNPRGCFRMPDGATATVPMMHQTEKLRYAEGADWQAVALDYDTCGRDGVPGFFIAILPKGGAREFAAALSPEKYRDIRSALANAPYEKTSVSLPKMHIEAPTLSLKKFLVSNGLECLFRCADFSGFTDEKLVVDDVVQRCHVIVDEEKTEAAAVTSAIMVRGVCRPHHSICFDRPFLWAIDDLSTGAAPYFLGLFEKP